MKIPLQALILMTGVLVVRVLPVQPRADALQPAVRASGAGEPARRGVSGARARVRQPVRGAQVGRRGAGVGRRATAARPAAMPTRARRSSAQTPTSRASASQAVALVKDVTGDARYTDVNYVFPTFILSYMPMGLVGSDDRGHPRRRDVGQLGRAERARHGDGDRLLQAARATRRRRTRRILFVSKIGDGVLGPVRLRRSRSTPRISDRSSRSSTASARSSTDRCSACSFSRSASSAPTGTARSSG